jgi:hypothetical protein
MASVFLRSSFHIYSLEPDSCQSIVFVEYVEFLKTFFIYYTPNSGFDSNIQDIFYKSTQFCVRIIPYYNTIDIKELKIINFRYKTIVIEQKVFRIYISPNLQYEELLYYFILKSIFGILSQNDDNIFKTISKNNQRNKSFQKLIIEFFYHILIIISIKFFSFLFISKVIFTRSNIF